jgi:hypothetical protein
MNHVEPDRRGDSGEVAVQVGALRMGADLALTPIGRLGFAVG